MVVREVKRNSTLTNSIAVEDAVVVTVVVVAGSGWCCAAGPIRIERDCRSTCERGLNEPVPRPRRTWPLICESGQLASYWQHRHIHRQFLCDGEDRPCRHHCRRRSGDKDRQLLPSRTCVGGHTLGAPQDLTAHHQNRRSSSSATSRARLSGFFVDEKRARTAPAPSTSAVV
jgi:hypothetical protein